ncbi:MAG: hypothetical protein NWR87_00720 [Rhodospirillales bacterium]|nr:hypothetical protein [Rhodospirillales bacterium]
MSAKNAGKVKGKADSQGQQSGKQGAMKNPGHCMTGVLRDRIHEKKPQNSFTTSARIATAPTKDPITVLKTLYSMTCTPKLMMVG